MLDVLGKMREYGKYVKMRDVPHDCGMVDTVLFDPGSKPYDLSTSKNVTVTVY